MLSGVNGVSPWAADASESAHFIYLRLLLVGTLLVWFLSGVSLMVLMLMRFLLVCLITPMSGLMVILFWIGLLVFLLPVLGSFLFVLGIAGVAVSGRHVHDICLDGVRRSCRGFCSVPGLLQSVQRAEVWSVILALQSSSAVHLGVDNLGVVCHVGRLLVPLPLPLSLSTTVICFFLLIVR